MRRIGVPEVESWQFGSAVDAIPPGTPIDVVLQRLGPAELRWDDALKCVSCYPCTPSKQRGPVLFFRRGNGCGFDIGWYLFFDAQGRLVEVESATT